MRRLGAWVLPVILAVLIAPGELNACPSTRKVPDYNCDQKVQVAVLGDSLVWGIGDTANNNYGGYVLRAARKLKPVEVLNLGKPGQFAQQLLISLSQDFRRGGSETTGKLLQSDIVILDVGRNDRWFFGEPIATYRDLKKIAKLIRDKAMHIQGYAPLIVTAVLMYPNRGAQGPWVWELDSYILKGSTAQFPADLRFDLVSKRFTSTDGIHPTSEGYAAIAQVLVEYLTKNIPRKMRQLRPDTDADGIYDFFEPLRFGTDPKLWDTDGDSHKDGNEGFKLKSNPLDPLDPPPAAEVRKEERTYGRDFGRTPCPEQNSLG